MDLLTIAGSRRNSALGYVFALGSVALAFLVRLTAGAYMAPFSYLIFIPAVVIAAFFGGTGAGLLSAALSILMVQYVLESGVSGPSPDGTTEIIGMVCFALNAILLICVVNALLSALRSKAQRETEMMEFHAGLDRVVAERTDLLKLEMTEHVAAQTQMRELQKIETIGQLTGGLAHDFNNMLAVIVGSLDIAERRLERGRTEELGSLIRNARDGARRAANLTNRLLAFSRRQPLTPEVIDPNLRLQSLPDLLGRSLDSDVRIELKLADNLWPISVDVGQLEQAVLNLALNARDAMPAGGTVTVTVDNAELDQAYLKAHPEVRPGQYLRISVADTGVGMAPEVMERAFDPFYTTKGPGNGTGLGLSQVFGWIKQSGGHIRILSSVGQGTTVCLYLPRYTGKERPAQEEASRTQRPTEPLREEVVMVVEDEDNVRQMTVEALRELGYSVIEASGGRDALQQLSFNLRIDILFTDIVMPDMNGKLVADAVKDRFPAVKVIFTTGYTRNAIVHNGIVEPGINLLLKPFTLEQLSMKISEVLRR